MVTVAEWVAAQSSYYAAIGQPELATQIVTGFEQESGAPLDKALRGGVYPTLYPEHYPVERVFTRETDGETTNLDDSGIADLILLGILGVVSASLGHKKVNNKKARRKRAKPKM